MIEKVSIYNSNLLKGTGLVQEMLVLINTYESGESLKDFQKRVVKTGLLSKSTDKRTIDIVRSVFGPRFLNNDFDVPSYLKLVREGYTRMDIIIQLFLIYTCRANPILADFISEVYFKLSTEGKASVSANDPKNFIRSAISEGKIIKPWSASTIDKVSQHINACLIDFGLVDKSKRIQPFRAFDLTVNYLLHELHFQGLSDIEILFHKDWQIFNLDSKSLALIVEKISFKGTFIFQYSGEILKIGWNYKTMEEFIKNECR